MHTGISLANEVSFFLNFTFLFFITRRASLSDLSYIRQISSETLRLTTTENEVAFQILPLK